MKTVVSAKDLIAEVVIFFLTCFLLCSSSLILLYSLFSYIFQNLFIFCSEYVLLKSDSVNMLLA